VLTRARVRNFRSLHDLDVELHPLNVLVGPNGSGKSNIVQSLELLREYAVQGTQVLSQLQSFKGTLWGDSRRGPSTVAIELEGEIRAGSGVPRAFRYSWEVTRERQAWTHLSMERFSYLPPPDERVLVQYPSKSDQVQFFKEDGTASFSSVPSGLSSLSMAAQQAEEGGLGRFASDVLGWQFLSPVPTYARGPQEAKRETRLGSGGENLSGVLHSLQAEDRDAFDRVVEALRAAVPEITSISTPVTTEGKTYVEATEAGISGRVPIWSLSDGTVALLALFTLLERPVKPALICIEEPENYLHPGIMEHLAESIQRASESTQIIVTTHSPFLLNLMDPQVVLVVEKTDGKTSVRPARDITGVKEAAKKLGLGELWMSGGIGGTP
jgi:predicted ATPase